MIEDMIDAAKEEEVDGLLGIAQCAEEMFVEPRAALAADELLAGKVGGRRCSLNANQVTSFDFRHVGHGIQIQDVGWRTMRLVAYSFSALFGPLAPRHGIFFEDERLNDLTEVVGHAVVHFGCILSQ